MARDYQSQPRQARTSSQRAGQNNVAKSGGRAKYRQQVGDHDLPEPEKFQIHSAGDVSLKKIIERLSGQPLGRSRATVVTIISKDSIDEPIKAHLIGALTKDVPKKHNWKNTAHESSQLPGGDGPVQSSDNIDKELLDYFDNQIVGTIDYKTGLIVLYLSSLLESATIGLMCDRVADRHHNPKENQRHWNIVDTWPSWNHNLLKSLLLLFSISHIVVFYSPEPSMDYNLIQMFKMLQALMSKSQTRIVDLLEAIGSTQVFPQQWARLARVACPRTLFVCDISYLNVEFEGPELSIMKQELEDQIYLLLNKTHIISDSGSAQNQSHPLLCLPDRGDYVFFITSKDLRNLGIVRPKPPETIGCPLDRIYTEVANLIIRDDDTKSKQSDNNELKTSDRSDGPQIVKVTSRPYYTSFSKFINRHVVNIQDKSGNPSMILPRLDDLFTVILRLKSLLFPPPQPVEDSENISPTVECSVQDERRFVDIHDLLNVEELFSKRHCLKARTAAMEAYIRSVQLPETTHQMASESAKELYLNHARGTACEFNLNLLVDQCNRHWFDSGNMIRDNDRDGGRARKSVGAYRGVSRTMSSLVGSPSRESEKAPVSHAKRHTNKSSNTAKKNSLTITRRSNGIQVTTSCDCGRDSSLLVTPTDRKKKLERVDVLILNE